FALDAIMAVYPDALIVQMHRDPSTIIASVCSLNEKASEGWSEKFRGPVVGETQLDLWARGAERFLADRARYDQAQFADVHYDDFVADPVATIAGIYQRFGLPFTAEAEAAMRALHAESTTGAARPSHRYTLADYGLTAEQVDERFQQYRAVHFPGR